MTKIFKAPIPSMISSHINNPVLGEAVTILAGSMLMALLAQISIHLPFSPVPITGQTFGASLLALLWGRNRAVASFVLYLAEGSLGLPVFANGQAFLSVGPTLGYLIGMLISAWVVGGLSDCGYTKTFSKALASCYLGSVIVFTLGLLGLSYFVPGDKVLVMGLIPFLPGDLLKNLLAASLASKIHSCVKK